MKIELEDEEPIDVEPARAEAVFAGCFARLDGSKHTILIVDRGDRRLIIGGGATYTTWTADGRTRRVVSVGGDRRGFVVNAEVDDGNAVLYLRRSGHTGSTVELYVGGQWCVFSAEEVLDAETVTRAAVAFIHEGAFEPAELWRTD